MPHAIRPPSPRFSSRSTKDRGRRTRTGRSVRWLVAVVALGVAGTACSSGSGSAKAPSGGTAVASQAADATSGVAALVQKYRSPSSGFTAPGAAVDATSLKGGSLYYVALSQQIPVLAIEQKGIEQAATALGMSFHVCDGKFQPALAAACINQAVSAGATGIFTDSVVIDAVSTAAANATSHNVPIVAISAIGTDSKGVTFRTNGDELSEGVAADWIVADSGGKAKVLMTRVQDDSGALNDIAQGSKPVLDKCSGCTQVMATYTSGTVPGIPSLISSTLLKNRDLDYGLPQFDFLIPLFKSGVQTAGYTDKMKVVSTNAVLSSMQLVKSGGQAADAGSNRNYSGWAAADTMVRMVKGVTIPPKTDIPVRLFDKTNIDSVQLTEAAAESGEWFGPLDYQKDFAQLWGLR